MANEQQSLALILAPPGYGKTSLLSDWSECDERPFAWVTFDARSGASVEAAGGAILAGLRSAPGIPPAPRSRRSTADGAAWLATIPAIAERMSTAGSFVLVLDDVHLVEPTSLRTVVETLLSALPRGSQIALASRTEPSLPIGALRAKRLLVEIGMQDLAMSSAEAASLLRNAQLDLEFDSVQTLVRRTEGWPAALYLAALSLRAQADVPTGLRQLSGADHLLSAYLRDEFLGTLSPALMRFVTHSSVLEELSGPFCDAVLRETASAVTLSQLERMTQLLVPLDSAHTRYRWHRVLRESLGAELRRVEPGLESQLHRSASSWHEDHGDLPEAITHAVAADDPRRAGDLLWPHILDFTATGQGEQALDWLSGFSDEHIAGYCPLALSAAHSALAVGRIEDARQWGLAAAAAHADAEPADGLASLEAGLALIEAMGPRVDAARMGALARRAYELEPDISPWRASAAFAGGVAAHLGGDHANAERLLAEAVDSAGAAQPSVASLSLAQLAMLAIEQQQWELAGELCERASAVVTRSDLAERPLSALVFAASAAVHAHWGHADEAKRDLGASIDLLAALGEFIPWYSAETRILLAHASLGLADLVRARTLLAEASRCAHRTPDGAIFAHWFDDAWAYMDTLAETSLRGASSLTIAELRILRFLPSHRSFREIGEQLGVSANTVKTQAHAIYRKLGAVSRSEAVARATEAGLLGL